MRAPPNATKHSIGALSEILPRLADVARIPERQRASFETNVRRAVTDVWHSERNRQAGLAFDRGALAQAARSMKSASDALSRLDNEERKRLEFALNQLGLDTEDVDWDDEGISGYIPAFAQSVEQCDEMAGTLADALQWCIGETSPDRTIKRRKQKGRRPGTFKNRQIRSFAQELRKVAERGGGRLTLARKNGSGTLIEALRADSDHFEA